MKHSELFTSKLNEIIEMKKMYIRLYKKAKQNNDEEMVIFFSRILTVYEENKIGDHIIWRK